MSGLLDAFQLEAGLVVGAAAAVLWAVLLYGPSQYAAGGVATASRLDAATNTAIQELANEADRARFLRRQCLERVGVYHVATGRCVERPAE
ncbi:hypothetical protein QEZ48_09295 [Aquamicrobium lusatiense]|uniref:hypothetical protein n=1 Tax=Aquamicrobium lusatiense TaxID=89772 RepID=UPI002457083B|nr:hypothetical protein [Aquamicrobium lusatiense]MDH4991024.1 hypothetical protein [Aquamicrobium lusatiense]